MAIVTFAPSGQSMNTDLTVASRGPITDPALQIPNVTLQHTMTGNLGAQVNDAGRNLIVWKDLGKESTRASWPMDSAAAVEAGLETIQAQINNDNLAFTIGSDGEMVTPS